MKRWSSVQKSAIRTVIVIVFLGVVLLLVRLATPSEIDDMHPQIACEQGFVEESDVIWVIPLYRNVSIADNREWCTALRALNKTLGMHGVFHTYREFEETRDERYVVRGIQEFEKCFGFRPEKFKAPQLVLSKENALLLRGMGFEIHGKVGQVMHKVYHCADTGQVRNWVIKWM